MGVHRTIGAIPHYDVSTWKNDLEEVFIHFEDWQTRGRHSFSQGTGEGVMELACCQGRKGIPMERLLEYASRSGPLFGEDDESAIDWMYAVQAAYAAVIMQECANGLLTPRAVYGMLGELPQKRGLVARDTGISFTHLAISFAISSGYEDILALPVMVRSCSDGHWHYAFATATENGKMDISAFSLPGEMTLADYYAIGRAVGMDSSMDTLATRNLSRTETGVTTTASSAYGFANDAIYKGTDEELGEGDRASLAILVRAIAAAHVTRAEVDPFAAGEETGYLVFPSTLDELWYDFSCSHERIRIGFCERCGSPFPIVARHGRKRRFCSRACKTTSANRLGANRRKQVREAFFNGDSVDQIVASHGVSRDVVCEALSSWPLLKQRIEQSIKDDGLYESALVARCRAEGLDIRRLLRTHYL